MWHTALNSPTPPPLYVRRTKSTSTASTTTVKDSVEVNLPPSRFKLTRATSSPSRAEEMTSLFPIPIMKYAASVPSSTRFSGFNDDTPPPSLQRGLSGQGIELLVTGLNDIDFRDDNYDFDEQDFAEDFMHMVKSEFYVWYILKTDQEKKWLNKNQDATKMVRLALNGFDNLMKLNGVSL